MYKIIKNLKISTLDLCIKLRYTVVRKVRTFNKNRRLNKPNDSERG